MKGHIMHYNYNYFKGNEKILLQINVSIIKVNLPYARIYLHIKLSLELM
jgi:hypothetical protein